MPERLVIDASVAAKWFLKDPSEADVDLADDILSAFLAGDIELHAPRILSYELCGLLAKACAPQGRRGARRLSKEKAIAAVQEFFGLPIQISEATMEEGVEALEMAVDYAKRHYDMIYLPLLAQDRHDDNIPVTTFAVHHLTRDALALEPDFFVGFDPPFIVFIDLQPDTIHVQRFKGIAGHERSRFCPIAFAPFAFLADKDGEDCTAVLEVHPTRFGGLSDGRIAQAYA